MERSDSSLHGYPLALKARISASILPWVDRRSEDERSIPPTPTKKRKLSQSSALDEKASDAPIIQSRKLPPIQPDRLAALQHISQRAPSLCSVPPPPLSTLPKQSFSRPTGFENLLNPASEDKVSASGRQHDGEETDSSRTAPIAATPSLRVTVLKKESLGDIPLPSISPALMETYPPLPQSLTPGSPTSHGSGLVTTDLSSATIDRRQASFVIPRDHASTFVGLGPLLPSETTMAPSIPPAHTYSPPPRRTTHVRPSLESHHPANLDPPFLHHPHSARKGFNVPILEAGQSQTMIIGLEQGPIQVPIDVQAASKVTDERRKRNATASHNVRQRRKKEEREISDKIADLEAQVQEVTKLKEHYQLECDFLWDVIQQRRIAIPRPPSPRPRQVMLGSFYETARVG